MFAWLVRGKQKISFLCGVERDYINGVSEANGVERTLKHFDKSLKVSQII
jgi:hypothetical protein